MTIKASIAIFLGKSSQFILQKLFKRGSTFPGRLALTIDPQILDTLARDYQIVVVTGTNGKTLTTALTVGILKHAFGPIVTNTSGANMITGIVSTFLTAKRHQTGQKIAVLEIDEASLPAVTDYLTPSLFVFTNIFRDQMDRYGEIYTTYELIVKGAAKAPEATVLLNGDSPLFNAQPLVNPVQYYGFDYAQHAPQRAHYNTEGVLCPKCHQILDYQLNTYANLGNYICQNCGFHRPKLNYRLSELTSITNTASEFVIDGATYQINVGGLYNIYNALAAVSVAEFFNIPAAVIQQGFSHSHAVFGRQESFKIGDKSCTLVLIKNPVGANQVLDMMKLAPYDFTLVALLNANYADGIDTSWIWDANFETIQALRVTEVITGGVRHSEMARRIRVAGYDPAKITESDQLAEVLDLIQNGDSQHVYILATYTAMLAMRELLSSQHVIDGEMK
ncbi:MAG: Mur ligase family protein [Streptococcaceae bacterium]|jgi:UDP-N-acetylmuramoyl-L-alanyl-D-glutamate--2,6-diaminopimelate ligase|nr:Mur ligase family protein [Streptococcaceae bacterium]